MTTQSSENKYDTYSAIGPNLSPLLLDAMIEQLPAPTNGQPVESLKVALDMGIHHVVDDEFGGEVIDMSECTPDRAGTYGFTSPAIQQAMSLVGFRFVHDANGKLAKVLYPNPERLQRASAANHISIAFTDDARGYGKVTSQREYARKVLDKKHPVSINNWYNYQHDIGIDHLLAAVVCGDAIFSVINSAAVPLNFKTHAYDRFTVDAGQAIRALAEGDLEKYAKIMGKSASESSYHRYMDQKLTQHYPGLPTKLYRSTEKEWGGGTKAHAYTPKIFEAAIQEGIERLGLEIPSESHAYLSRSELADAA